VTTANRLREVEAGYTVKGSLESHSLLNETLVLAHEIANSLQLDAALVAGHIHHFSCDQSDAVK